MRILEFSKLQNVNIQKPTVLLYTRNEKLETNFKNSIYNIKYKIPRDKSYKDGQDLYYEAYKILLRN